MGLMSVPGRPTYLYGGQTAATLRALADRAERGEVIGVAIAIWTIKRETEMGLAGVFKTAPHLAHYAVSQMQGALLYPDDGL